MEQTPENKKKEPAFLWEQRKKTPGFSRPFPKGMETARIFSYEEFKEQKGKARWQQERKKLIEKYRLPLDATDDDIENEERAERGASKEADQAGWERDHGMN